MKELVKAVEEVRKERVKGASWAMRRLAEAVISDAESGRITCNDAQRVGSSIINANRVMGSLWNLASFIAKGCSSGKTIEWGARMLLWYSSHCRELMAANLAGVLDPGSTVFTLSYSSAVELVLSLNQDRIPRVYVSMSYPGGEGIEFAKSLRRMGFNVILLHDSDMYRGIRESKIVLIGADSVSLQEECVFNKLGSLQASIIARFVNRRAAVVFESYKIHPELRCDGGGLEVREERISGWGSVFYSLFDQVPFKLLDVGLTEAGIIGLDKKHLENAHNNLLSIIED